MDLKNGLTGSGRAIERGDDVRRAGCEVRLCRATWRWLFLRRYKQPRPWSALPFPPVRGSGAPTSTRPPLPSDVLYPLLTRRCRDKEGRESAATAAPDFDLAGKNGWPG